MFSLFQDVYVIPCEQWGVVTSIAKGASFPYAVTIKDDALAWTVVGDFKEEELSLSPNQTKGIVETYE